MTSRTHSFRKQLLISIFLLIAASVLTSQTAAQTGIQWEKDLEKAKSRARAENKPLLLHFYGDACAPCQLMARDVFPNPQVIAQLNADFIAVKINASATPELMAPYQVSLVPTDVFLSPTGEKVHVRKGGANVATFLGEVTTIAAKFPKPQPTAQPALQPAYPLQVAQIPQNGTITQAEYYQQNMAQPANIGQQADFSGFSASQVPVFQPPVQQDLQPASDDSEGFAVSGNANEQLQPADMIARLQQMPSPATVPTNQAISATAPQQTFQPQLPGMPQTNLWESQNASPVQTVATVPQNEQMPVPMQPNPPTFAAAMEVPVGSFDNGVIRRQPATGMGAGNSLGVVAAVNEMPTTVQMPTIALDGYCPVSLAQTAKWVKGSAEITTEHEGVVFRFVSVEARNIFAVNPGLYAPVLRGNDAVELLTNRRETAGQRKFGAWYHGQVFLFASAENYTKFQNNPELYAFQTQQTANQQTSNTLAASHVPIN